MKKRLLCPNLPKPGSPSVLSENEAHHATRVLRLREGETVEAMDGKGNQSLATLRIKGGIPRLEYLETKASFSTPRKGKLFLPIHIEMAVLKGDAMEWVVEKAVELGVHSLTPVLTDHTVVQMKSKGPEQFQERWQKIADQALKQCGRLDQMEISLPISLEELLTQDPKKISEPQTSFIRLWCDEESSSEPVYLMDWLNSREKEANGEAHPLIRLLIGPEGGWSSNERLLLQKEMSSSPIHRIGLGPRVLRAETAALFSVSVVTAFLSKS